MNLKIKRYTLHWSEMRPDDEGEWVRYEAVAALQAEIIMLKEQLAAATICKCAVDDDR